jgi:hypothetical protein
MPLLLDPASRTEEELREMLKAGREEFREFVVGLTTEPPGPVKEPLSLLTAADLLRDVVTLSERVDRPGADPRVLTAMVNVQYDALLCAIDLMKSHVEMPAVPRARR